jgi:single-strand DNA-binding protein
MNILTFVGRIGRDAEVRDANGTAVCNLAICYNYGKKDAQGKQNSQWVDAALWGNRADALAQYLVKGQQVAVAINDVHIETFTKADNTVGTSLRGNVMDISFAGPAPQQQDGGGQQRGGQQRQAPAQQRQQPTQRSQGNQQRPAQRQAAGGKTGGFADDGFSDMDEDIPFVSADPSMDMVTSKSRRMKRCEF